MQPMLSVAPTHVAIIMDGNGRWAERQGRSRIFGHRKGVEAVRNVVDACGRRGIPYLTLYAFRSENWKLPKEEVRLLTELLFTTLEKEAIQLHENGIRLRVIGDLAPFGGKIDKSVEIFYKLLLLFPKNNTFNEVKRLFLRLYLVLITLLCLSVILIIIS